MTLEEAKKNIQERMNILLKRYGEWKDAHPGWFASGELIGQVEGLEEAMGILVDVDTEPVVKDKLTLRELARELRKIFGFGYLVAYGSELYGYRVRAYLLKPKYIPIGGFWFNETRGNDALLDISFSDLMCDLDLSEYEDEDGNIDYSRCIVEVKE